MGGLQPAGLAHFSRVGDDTFTVGLRPGVEHLPALSLSVSLCLARSIHTYTIEPVTERLEAVGTAGLATLQESLLIQKSLRAHTDRRARRNNVIQ